MQFMQRQKHYAKSMERRKDPDQQSNLQDTCSLGSLELLWRTPSKNVSEKMDLCECCSVPFWGRWQWYCVYSRLSVFWRFTSAVEPTAEGKYWVGVGGGRVWRIQQSPKKLSLRVPQASNRWPGVYNVCGVIINPELPSCFLEDAHRSVQALLHTTRETCAPGDFGICQGSRNQSAEIPKTVSTVQIQTVEYGCILMFKY